MKTLVNFNWKPLWTTHMGCLCACKDYLGVDVSDAAIFGATGHAFVINVHEELCPSGPTAWRSTMLFENIRNLGLEINGCFGWKGESEDKYRQLQKKAWDYIRQCIDRDLPCYCWYMDEYSIIDGYDEVGYFLKGVGHEEGKGPLPWEMLGKEGVSFVEAYALRKSQQPTPVPEMIKSTFSAVLKHASNTEGWIFDGYRSGTEAYTLWITSMEQGKADRFGNSYNARVWGECRAQAVIFLEENSAKLSGEKKSLIEEGLDHYRIVSENLKVVSGLYPLGEYKENETCPVDDTCAEAVKALKAARAAEGKALDVLEKFVNL